MTMLAEHDSRVSEKAIKARRTFYSGKTCVLNMITCGLTFCAMGLPTLTFGREVWILDDDVERRRGR